MYSKKDAIGKLFDTGHGDLHNKVKVASSAINSSAKVPRCKNCGAGRVFELQLTPQLISELEVDELSVDGMDWGTIILAVCSADCQLPAIPFGSVGYVEEWIGVQGEELDHK